MADLERCSIGNFFDNEKTPAIKEIPEEGSRFKHAKLIKSKELALSKNERVNSNMWLKLGEISSANSKFTGNTQVKEIEAINK